MKIFIIQIYQLTITYRKANQAVSFPAPVFCQECPKIFLGHSPLPSHLGGSELLALDQKSSSLWVDPEEMEQIQIPDANQSREEDDSEN